MVLPSELVYLLLLLHPRQNAAFHVPWQKHTLLPSRKFGELENWNDGSTRQGQLRVQGVRKMSQDEGEMFFPEYWTIHKGQDLAGGSQHWWQAPGDASDESEGGNSSFVAPALAAYAIHEPYSPLIPLGLDSHLRIPRALLALTKRDFQCPGGTTACTSIDRPNSCCQSGFSCKAITGSQGGNVGCCAEGANCGSAISDCAPDQLSCPGSQGGGCCLPGYTCAGVGCAAASTATVTINPTVTASPSSTRTSSSSTTSAVVSVSTAATTSTRVATTSSSVSTEAPVAPAVRPNSGSASVTLTSTGPTTTYTPTSCPTGFYACNAHYLGGCCRVGRDCSSTTCPAPESSLVLNTNGVSIGVAPASPTRLGQDGCALGWFRCDSGGGGGCCPSGFACGESCTATAVNLGAGVTGTAKVAKDNGNLACRTTGLSNWISVVAQIATMLIVVGEMMI